MSGQSHRFRVLVKVVLPTEVVVKVVVGVVALAPVVQSRLDFTNISVLSAVEVLHAPHSECEKDDAPENMRCMVVTLDTSHLEMSPSNDDAELNMYSMSVTLETSHFERSPLNDDA